MNDLVPIFVIGILTIGAYRLFELFVRKNERMTIIEKWGDKINPVDFDIDLNLPFFQQSKTTSWALKISLLLIGVGLGTIIAFIVENSLINISGYNPDDGFHHRIGVLYSACVAIFGGLGLLTAYFVEQKKNKS